MERQIEIKHQIPVECEYDVVVTGGGPAGVCAAVAAARKGAKVLLIEKNGCVGGIWTAGALSWVLDAYDKKGIMEEITQALIKSASGRVARNNIFIADVEQMKLLLENMLAEAKVDLMLHTRLTSAVVENGVLPMPVFPTWNLLLHSEGLHYLLRQM